MRGQTGKEEGTTRAGSNAARGSACRPFRSGTAHRHAGTEVWEPAPGHGSRPTGAPPPAVPPHWTGGREVLGREGRGAGYSWRQPPPSTNPQGSCQHAPVCDNILFRQPAAAAQPARRRHTAPSSQAAEIPRNTLLPTDVTRGFHRKIGWGEVGRASIAGQHAARCAARHRPLQ